MGSADNKQYLHLSTNTSQIVSPNPGCILGAVIANISGTTGATTAGTLAIYDDTSAVAAHQIANITFTNPNVPGWNYHTVVSRALFIVFTQPTGAGAVNGDLTLTYQ